VRAPAVAILIVVAALCCCSVARATDGPPAWTSPTPPDAPPPDPYNTITGLDEAGNKAVDTLSIVPGAKLYSPARGSNVTSPPLLAWRPFAGATYYNLQLYVGVGNAFRRVASVDISGRKILSAWPLKPHYRLKKAWKWNKKRALSRGHYRWYVYPGLGKRSANKYGPLIGSSDFYVVKR